MPLQALVVLGCRVSVEQRSGAWRRRTARTAQAWHAGLAPLVIASGGRRWAGATEADAFAEALIADGVPSTAVLRELRSLTTWQNAEYTLDLMRSLGVDRVGLVTCHFHMQRALRCFAALGVEAVALPAPGEPDGWARELYFGVRERVAWELARAGGKRQGRTSGRSG